ncbi:hypothetical protein BST61_g4493 [Cercospora zeina]
MYGAINESFRGERFMEWLLDHDSTIAVPRPGGEPWGPEVISPILHNETTKYQPRALVAPTLTCLSLEVIHLRI